MKQINGTITLSFLEEDNQQRVIFRVVPLCTREGVVFRDKSVDFPDQGSLRIVPDKREQSTFKERMRSMGSLCAIQLCSEGKELAKVRQNRNYDPNQGESNQFAIYSDVICEFAEDGAFEVFPEGADCSCALSPLVLLRRGKVLYGPLARDAAPDWDALRPFGNDSYLLHAVELADGLEHSFYWNPDLTVTWRQRRGTLRRGKTRPGEGVADGEALEPAEPNTEPEKPIEPANGNRTLPPAASVERVARSEAPRSAPPRKPEPAASQMKTTPERPAPRETVRPDPAEPAEVGQRNPRNDRRRDQPEEAAMPIGKRLSILDDRLPFEEQISKLDQPLPGSANLLNHAGLPVAMESRQSSVRTNGTPLMQTGARVPMPIRRGDPVHYVVDRQIRTAHREHAELQSDFVHIENPMENFQSALEQVWQSPETRSQVLQSLCENEAFMQSLRKHLQQQGRDLSAVEAAKEQLDEIEAERLCLLIQLDALRNDQKRAMETMHAEQTQKKREEIAQLEAQLTHLKENREKLEQLLTSLGEDAKRGTLDWLAGQDLRLCACSGDTIALIPTLGVRRTPAEMVASVCAALRAQGFACDEDGATEMLLHFALNDEICLLGETLPESEMCARAFLQGLGLLGVTARTDEHTRLEIASFLPENGLRAPTVEVCLPGRPALPLYGHKTIRLLEGHSSLQPSITLPILYTPAYRPGMLTALAAEPSRPASLESFAALGAEAEPLLERGEAWFAEVEKKIGEQSPALAQQAAQPMRVFLSAASGKLRGGFLAAADAAMLSWVVPEVYKQALNPEPLRAEIGSLPRCLAALGIQ